MRIVGTKKELSALKEALECPDITCPKIKEHACIKCAIAHNGDIDGITYDDIEVLEEQPQTPGQLYGGVVK